MKRRSPFSHRNERLMLITQRDSHNSLPMQIDGFLAGGGTLVQLRIKGYCHRGLEDEARWAHERCLAAGGRLIVNDHVDAAKASGAYGVHLGRDDMEIGTARKQLGDNFVIGATAHNLDEALTAVKAGADYLGVGPLRFTSSKERLAPILGFEGVIGIISQLREAQIDVPVFVVGGVESADVRGLIKAGAFGVAVSASIALANDPTFATQKFLESIDKALR